MTLRFEQVYTDDDTLDSPDGFVVLTVIDVSRIGDQLRWSVVLTEAPSD